MTLIQQKSALEETIKSAGIPYKEITLTSVTVSVKMHGRVNAEKLNVIFRASGWKTNVLSPKQTFDNTWTVGGFLR